MHVYIAIVTLATVLLLVAVAVLVGRARGRYGVKAPGTTGPEGFERAFRVQMNTQEAALMFLPALWTAAHFGLVWISAMLGVVWLVARIWYAVAYANPSGNRGPAFAISLLALLGLILQALWGVIWTLALA
jgi:glutathione S-transferase